MTESFVPTASGGGTNEPVHGCNHPDAISYDPTVTVYVPGSCAWPTPTPTPVPDTTAPTTVVAPSEAGKTATSRSLSATINEAGTGYCTAVVSGATAPTSAEVVANNNANVIGTGGSVVMTANAAATCTVTGITVNVTYDFYFVAKDTVGNLQTAPSGPLTMTSNVTCGAGMVKFDGGTFTMGDDTDVFTNNWEHTVTLSDFCIDATEVTQAQYDAWGGDGGHPGYGFPGANNPAEMVDWTNASAYCVAQGKRLPTEAEWEYAARNGGTVAVNAYATGSVTAPVACADANFNNCNGAGSTIAVGSYAASASGLYDMAGNVWEWTGDFMDVAYYADGQVDPTGPTTGVNRVIRGGAWERPLVILRASLRAEGNPADRLDVFGFRCASN